MHNRLTSLLLCLLLLLPAAAHSATPRVLLLVADHVNYSDVASELPRWGVPGLLSEGMPARPEPVAAVYATMGAGDTIPLGNVSQGRLGRALRAAGRCVAVIGDGDGEYRPLALMLPRPDVLLTGAAAGETADPLAPGGWRVNPDRMARIAEDALRANDLVVVHDGDPLRLERENDRGKLTPPVYAAGRRDALASLERLAAALSASCAARGVAFAFVVSCPRWSGRGRWDSLTPCAVLMPTADRAATLTSATTHTMGLIAARDVAPAVLHWLGVPQPVQMTGAPIDSVRTVKAGGLLERLDRMTALNQRVQTPFFWVLGFTGAAVALGALFLCASGRLSRKSVLGRVVLFGLRAAVAWPLSLMLAPCLDPHTAAGYLAAILSVTLLIALIPSPEWVLGVTAAAVVLDGLLGSRLIAQSVLSTYALAGIRFYGIGNEYMGMLIAGSLALVCVLDGKGPEAFRRLSGGLAAWFLLADFVLSFPAFGAKAGGAVTATATFLFAWRLLTRERVGWRYGVLAVAVGFALVFVWGFLDHWLGAGRPTHIDSAVGAVSHGRFGYILGVSVRKVGLALRILFHPGTLLGLLGFALIAIVVWKFLGSSVRAFLERGAARRALFGAGLRGAVVALLFNDSGVVAAILMLMSLSVIFIHDIVRESQCGSFPSTSAK